MRALALAPSLPFAFALRLNAQALELPSVVRAGLDAYSQHGADAAINAWSRGSPINAETQASTRAAFKQIEAVYLKMIGYDVLRVVPLGMHGSRSYVVILFEKGPVYARFDCYKRGAGWITTAFFFNTKPDDILPSNMLGP